MIISIMLETGNFPKSLKDAKAYFLKQHETNIDILDPWSREYQYKINKKSYDGFDLYSQGKDPKNSKDDIHLSNEDEDE